ncbi:hypothetical protein FJTKL_15058 [Diaporthe vaccinii]|uniref:DUF427 domain-containing protein n=1 Tax=Diaporthe vaccinii TaxID=105482 RepID=A0ABR4E674_9PEZI
MHFQFHQPVVFLPIFLATLYFLLGHMNIFRMASKAKLNVQSFPRPPLLEKTPRHLQIKWDGHLIADTKDAYWALETHHPPTYYLPPSSIKLPLTKTAQTTYCEWKGAATYWSIANPASSSGTVSNRIWSYERPTKGFEAIKDYLSFYAGPWDCFVDGEKVEPQPGDFYGGWVTSDIDGIVKGKNGNWDPVL